MFVEWLLSGEKRRLAPLGLDDLDCDLKSLTFDTVHTEPLPISLSLEALFLFVLVKV